MFTETEMMFLAKRHRSNWSHLDARSLAKMPADVKQRIMEFRAKELGPEFTEYRSLIRLGQALQSSAPQTGSLTAAELF
jgi:hypothetical protein